jgi:hypothetical protein
MSGCSFATSKIEIEVQLSQFNSVGKRTMTCKGKIVKVRLEVARQGDLQRRKGAWEWGIRSFRYEVARPEKCAMAERA